MENNSILKNLVFLAIILILAACSVVNNRQISETGVERREIHSIIMLDGREWMIQNLEIPTPASFCQQDNINLCREYGRLYIWEDANNTCQLLGENWRLPTVEEWKNMVNVYGGFYGESEDNGRAAFLALYNGGNSRFNALPGGNREVNGNFERLNAHGFYWTATEADSARAWFINFAKGATIVNKHTTDKRRAMAVRCIKN